MELLDVSFNYLESLPEEIGGLKKLKKLYAFSNRLRELPKCKFILLIYLSIDSFYTKVLLREKRFFFLELREQWMLLSKDAIKLQIKNFWFEIALKKFHFLSFSNRGFAEPRSSWHYEEWAVISSTKSRKFDRACRVERWQ